MTEPSRAVFLSYASQDGEAARRICDALRVAGIEVWLDQSELRGGDAWDQKIRRQIRDCALFIPIISINTDTRTEGYFRLEWKLAVERSRLIADDAAFLVPVVIDITPDAGARVPDKFREVQWMRLTAGETPSGFVQRVSDLLSSPAHRAPTATGATRHAGTLRLRRSMLLLICAAAVIAGSYFAFDRFLAANRDVPASATTSLAQRAIPEKSIAVLPFVDMSEKHDQEYFSDGLTEELIDHLAHSADLKVIARTSSFQFKGKNEDVRSIAVKLGVVHVLEGSVRKSGNAFRITAQLIRAADGVHLWSQTYERSLKDIFEVQEEIAGTVATALHTVLKSAGPDLVGTSNVEAYDLYLRARASEIRFTRADVNEARTLYRRAVALDPTYAEAWSGLSRASAMLGEFEDPPNGWDVEARQAGDRLLQIARDSADAHFELRERYRRIWNWSAMRREDQALLERDISAASRVGTDEFSVFGNYQYGLALLEEGVRRDPLSKWGWIWLCDAYHVMSRMADAERACRTALTVAPDYESGHARLAIILARMRQRELALAEALRETDPERRAFTLAIVYRLSGRPDEAARSLSTVWPKLENMDKAEYFAAVGQADQAFDWWNKAIDSRDAEAAYSPGSPSFAALHQDPRYKAALRRIGAAE